MDPVTGKLEEPMIMFDQLIVNARAREAAAKQSEKTVLSEEMMSRPAEEVETFGIANWRASWPVLRRQIFRPPTDRGMAVPILSSHK